MRIEDQVKEILSDYRRRRDAMVSAPQTEEHPNGDIWVKKHLVGKIYLQYVALMAIAEVAGYTPQEMLDRFITRGITNEFGIWKDASEAGFLDKIL